LPLTVDVSTKCFHMCSLSTVHEAFNDKGLHKFTNTSIQGRNLNNVVLLLELLCDNFVLI